MAIISEQNIAERFKKKSEYFSGRRPDLIKLIPAHCQKILDVGCGAAEIWKNFKGEVHGIEINSEAATRASQNIKSVYNIDIETAALELPSESFDCIVFADVLEHMYDPWGVLLKYKSLLRKQGCVLISVPNIRHYRILRSLFFKGEFAYEESGILDIDHVRFFTYKEVVRMLKSTGFEIDKLERNVSASAKYKVVNKILFGAMNDFLTEQFYVLARLSK